MRRVRLTRGPKLVVMLAWLMAAGCDAGASPSDASASREASLAPGADAGGAGVGLDPQRRARDEARARLLAYEHEQLAEADFATATPWSQRAGDDPFRLLAVDGGAPIGLLRGRGALTRLGVHGEVGERVAVTAGASAMALDGRGVLAVVGPRSATIETFDVPPGDAPPRPRAPVRVEGARGLRSIAAHRGGATWAVGDPHANRVHVVARPNAPGPQTTSPLWSAPCALPLDVRFVGDRLLALCLLDHAVLVWNTDADGRPFGASQRVEHDGPIWALDASLRADGTLRLALAGVEDRPLDRSDGAFGYIDSFAFLVDVPGQGAPSRRLAVNVAEHGAVTPKWIRLHDPEAGPPTIDLIGYGGATRLSIRPASVVDDTAAPPVIESTPVLPGISDAVQLGESDRWIYADPLLDAWVVAQGSTREIIPTGQTPPPEVRLGEALAFTVAMAPHATSKGRRSRFTCETCHFEGGVDGRIHWTGRDAVHASTRPLTGLFGNRPHFSRALDPTMAGMVDNEFRVASRGTGVDPWFSLGPEDLPWLDALGVAQPQDAEALRRALMAFLIAFEPEPPAPAPRGDDALARRGADVFASHCVSCHDARRIADDPASQVPRERWLDEAATILWGTDARMKTGVLPYVHDQGARVPPLRRLGAKRPYFTNGSAKSLADVLSRFVVATAPGTTALHDAQPGTLEAGARRLTADERRALRAFLDRL